MIDCQILIEVYESLRRHITRTLFTGFGILWAMLLLVLLQGGSNVFYRWMTKKFYIYCRDRISISVNHTLAKKMNFTETIADNLTHCLDVFEHVAPIFETRAALLYEEGQEEFTTQGIDNSYTHIYDLAFVEGNFFTKRALQLALPVCILDTRTKEKLFGKDSAIGQSLCLHHTVVSVIGVVEPIGRSSAVLITSPFFKKLFPADGQTAARIVGILKPGQKITVVRAKIRNYLCRQLQMESPPDSLCMQSLLGGTRFQLFFLIMKALIWFITYSLLASGVVGVGNMMLVVVKERTQELAIRKVIGARPRSIMMLILLESVVIHLFAGSLGMGLGIGLLQWINRLPMVARSPFMRLEFNYTTLSVALVILLLASCLAALIPAKRALGIKLVNALK